MNFEALSAFHLFSGPHGSPEEGLCVMEAVAWLEGLPHSDAPACTCPLIAEFARFVNDSVDDETRQQLVPIIPLLVGTVSIPHQRDRAHIVWEFADYWRQEIPSLGRWDLLENAQRYCENLAYVGAVTNLTQYLLDYRVWTRCQTQMPGVLRQMIEAGPHGGATGNAESRVRAYRALVSA